MRPTDWWDNHSSSRVLVLPWMDVQTEAAVTGVSVPDNWKTCTKMVISLHELLKLMKSEASEINA